MAQKAINQYLGTGKTSTTISGKKIPKVDLTGD
jgi:hypothetical protein